MFLVCFGARAPSQRFRAALISNFPRGMDVLEADLSSHADFCRFVPPASCGKLGIQKSLPCPGELQTASFLCMKRRVSKKIYDHV